jgi:hypothetical protein
MNKLSGNHFKGLLTASRLIDELLGDQNFKQLSAQNRRTISYCKANIPDIQKLHKIRRESPSLQDEEYLKGAES